MSDKPFQVDDIIETPGHTHPRIYRVLGVHYGPLNGESVIEITACDQSAPGAHGKTQQMFVPVEMVQAGLSTGLFTLTRA